MDSKISAGREKTIISPANCTRMHQLCQSVQTFLYRWSHQLQIIVFFLNNYFKTLSQTFTDRPNVQLKRVSCFTLAVTFELNGGSLSLKTPQPKCGGVCLREAGVDIVLTSHVIPNENAHKKPKMFKLCAFLQYKSVINRYEQCLSHLWLQKLSSSSVSGKNTSPPSPPPCSDSLFLDFFLFILKGSRKPFFFGEICTTSPGPGLRGAGLLGKDADMSVGTVGDPSIWVTADTLGSLPSFPGGDLNLKRLFTLRVADLLMVTDWLPETRRPAAGVWAAERGVVLLEAAEGGTIVTGRTCTAGWRQDTRARARVYSSRALRQANRKWKQEFSALPLTIECNWLFNKRKQQVVNTMRHFLVEIIHILNHKVKEKVIPPFESLIFILQFLFMSSASFMFTLHTSTIPHVVFFRASCLAIHRINKFT